jgi:hypothetical protein
MGNRGGRLHRADRSLGAARWKSRAWICCRLAFRDRHRAVMGDGYTEIFFLDEATALAAGHRPCFTCRREAAIAFRDAWAIGNRIAAPAAREMDAVLHRERLDGRAKRLHPLPTSLPPGAMVAAGEAAFLISREGAWRWTFGGYTAVGDPPLFDGLLTPPSTLAALTSGYAPVLHPSAL